MRSYQLLLITAAARSSATNIGEKRDPDECSSVVTAFRNIMTDFPTADSAISTLLSAQTHLATHTDDACVPTITGDSSVAAKYTSWMSELCNWGAMHTSEYSELFSACSDNSDYATLGLMSNGCRDFTQESSAPSSDDSNDEDDDSAASRTIDAVMAVGVAVGMLVVSL